MGQKIIDQVMLVNMSARQVVVKDYKSGDGNIPLLFVQIECQEKY